MRSDLLDVIMSCTRKTSMRVRSNAGKGRYAEVINRANEETIAELRAELTEAETRINALVGRVEALARLLVGDGHLTPMGKRQIDKTLSEPAAANDQGWSWEAMP